jgi:hypothetical protein
MSSSEESEADEAMKALTRLFSDPKLPSKAHFRCSVDGPSEGDLLFESIIDEILCLDPSSNYKSWVRRLYRLGLISRIPAKWADPQDAEMPGKVGGDGDGFHLR